MLVNDKSQLKRNVEQIGLQRALETSCKVSAMFMRNGSGSGGSTSDSGSSCSGNSSCCCVVIVVV